MKTFLIAAILVPLAAANTVRLPVVQHDIKFNSVNSIKSSQVGDLLSALNGYTVHPNDPWQGLRSYNPLQHPTLFLIADFEMPKGMAELSMNSNLEFRLENDNQLDDEFNEFRGRAIYRTPQAEGKMIAVDAAEESPERLKEAQTLVGNETFDAEKASDRAFLLEYYTFKNIIADAARAPVNGMPSIAYWINLNSLKQLAADYGLAHEKTQKAASMFSKLVGLATGELESHPRSLLMVIQETEEPVVRSKRDATIIPKTEADAPADENWSNLATQYSSDFHIVFAMTAFTMLIIVLGVYATSIGMWFMDPGRDSIIYRMTSQRMKMD